MIQKKKKENYLDSSWAFGGSALNIKKIAQKGITSQNV